MRSIDQFSGTKVLVVGDIMLDRYWWGDVTRISPEAPVPVVRIKKDSYAPGGAANVAVNVAGLGASAILVGCVGDDSEAESLRASLETARISPDHLIVSRTRPTNTKTRVVAHNQHVVRVDRESTASLSAVDAAVVCDAITKLINEIDVVLLSDYAKGTLTSDVLAHVFKSSGQNNKPVFVDPKGKEFAKYLGAAILTPNRREAAEACNMEPENDNLVSHAGKELMQDLELQALLITESENGMTLFEAGKPSTHYDAVAKEVYDVTGAGDTVIATMAVAFAAGSTFAEAARLANIAAGIVVQQLGTASISREKLSSSITDASAAKN